MNRPPKPARPKRTRLRSAAKARERVQQAVSRRPTLDPTRRAELEGRIGYTFKEEGWLNRALTHPSLIDNFDGDAQFSNQRLEFLGDRVLGLVMAEMLISRFPKQREGYLTKLFHQLVSGETCALVGEQFGLRNYIFLDASLLHSKAGKYDKAVADAVEALIAAIYRDGGLEPAADFIRRHWIFAAIRDETKPTENPKTRLSDWCGAHKAPYAEYQTVSQDGPPHAPVFTVKAVVRDHGEATAKGGSKQEAEMAAASDLLDQLERDDRHI